MSTIKDEAIKIARKLRDECDGSYVGAEETNNININGVDIKLHVVSFWEKGFGVEYRATGDGIESGGFEYL
jgi:hypothetical protein